MLNSVEFIGKDDLNSGFDKQKVEATQVVKSSQGFSMEPWRDGWYPLHFERVEELAAAIPNKNRAVAQPG